MVNNEEKNFQPAFNTCLYGNNVGRVGTPILGTRSATTLIYNVARFYTGKNRF